MMPGRPTQKIIIIMYIHHIILYETNKTPPPMLFHDCWIHVRRSNCLMLTREVTRTFKEVAVCRHSVGDRQQVLLHRKSSAFGDFLRMSKSRDDYEWILPFVLFTRC